ncbi:MAG: ATP-binding protein [Flammeovirgaceae bacterium]
MEKAVAEGDSSIAASIKMGDAIGKAFAYATQASNYLHKKNYDKSIALSYKSIALFDSIGGNKQYIAIGYLNLTQAFIKKNDLGKANYYLSKSSSIANEQAIPSLKLQNALVSVFYYKTVKDYKKAFDNQLLVTQWNDSLNNKDSKEHVLKVQMLYEVEKKEQQLKILTQQEATQKALAKIQQNKLEKDNLIIVISCVSIVALLLVSLLLYNNSEKKEKINEELKALNLEITKQNEEISYNLIKINELNLQIENREKQYRGIIENAEDIICEINKEGFFTYSNPAGLKLLRYSMHELKQLNYFELLDNTTPNTVVETVATNLKKGARSFYIEAPITTKYKEQHWIGINVMRHSTSEESEGAEVFARNITERKKSEQYIKSINSRLENLIQAIQAGILVEDEKGNVVLTNAAFCEIFKIPLTAEQLIGFNCKDAAKQASQLFMEKNNFINEIEKIELNRKVVINNELKMVDGKILWRDYVPIITEGKFYGQMWIYRDVTSQKKLEHDLKMAKEEAELANEAKSEFLANISHELRTPLNAIIGFSDLLQKSKLETTQLKFTNIIVESSELLLKIIEDILDFSKIESGRLQLYIEPTNLQALGENALNVIRPKAEVKKITLVFNYQNIPSEVLVDQMRLQQILINLLSNALKFTETGQIELGILLTSEEGNKLKILFYVEDTGIGIAPENQEKIFEAFVQEDISTTKKFGGTGLGLTISNNLIKLMGGKLELISQVGKGSKFFFTLETEKQVAH